MLHTIFLYVIVQHLVVLINSMFPRAILLFLEKTSSLTTVSVNMANCLINGHKTQKEEA